MEFEQPNAQRRKRGADGKKKKSKTSEERKEKREQLGGKECSWQKNWRRVGLFPWLAWRRA